MHSLLGYEAAPTPRILWVELTSKCPVDCVFCSRKTRRGAGEHLPYALFEKLAGEIRDARKFILNYSGESTVYPHLMEAIQRARRTGAYVEMVSVLTTVPELLLEPLASSGLNRLTVSVHATDPDVYSGIYRYGSFESLRTRLVQLTKISSRLPHPPALDFAFVALDANLGQLASVGALASELSVTDISVFPVLRRDGIPVQFPSELRPDGRLRPTFDRRVRAVVAHAAQIHPKLRFHISTAPSNGPIQLDAAPTACGGELPDGAHIHSCEQNPWETVHVLSSGDVVPCEVLDKQLMGNLARQSLYEIWHGERYSDFRRQYRHGLIPECRTCPWKRAFLPRALVPEIAGSSGMHAQLLHGWHEPAGEHHFWSSQQATAIVAAAPSARRLHVSGILPPGPPCCANELTIAINGVSAETVCNSGQSNLSFSVEILAPESVTPSPAWNVEFRTTHVYRATERGTDTDQRDLGFALLLLASRESSTAALSRHTRPKTRVLTRSIRGIDRAALKLVSPGKPAPRRETSSLLPGLSILIPERDNVTELSACLESVSVAALHWDEPWEVIVLVNGAFPDAYRPLRIRHPSFSWRFHSRPLGFARAIRAMLPHARYDWVYLLNSDVALDPRALASLAPYRNSSTFSVASQIFFKDCARFREETNWGVLLVEDGLATIHDWIPRSGHTVPTFYSGGGASLFQRRVLKSLLDAEAYEPFYWEDVEWGWRARKLGYDSFFCPASIVHHRHRATIGRFYSAGVIEEIVARNRLLFHLRNFLTVGSLESAIAAIESSPAAIANWFLTPSALWAIARGRLWNHRAPIADEEVFLRWQRSLADSAVRNNPPTPPSPSSCATHPDSP